jgi:hypothetical protein
MRFFLLTLLACSACTAAKPVVEEPVTQAEPQAEATEAAPKAAQPHASTNLVFEGDLSFISVKNGDTPVLGTLAGFSGSAVAGPEEDGIIPLKGTLQIPLNTLSTELELRDQNILNAFFGVEANPVAFFELKRMSHPAPGTAGMWIDGSLKIGPFSMDVRGHFRATTATDGSQNLESGEAMILSISELGMGERLASLIALCQHKSVDDSVEVRAKGTIRFTVDAPAVPQ